MKGITHTDVETHVLADFTDRAVVVDNDFVTMRLEPALAMKMARELMRAAFTLGYEEPVPPSPPMSIALGPQSVVTPEKT